jgi:hypothetical protein
MGWMQDKRQIQGFGLSRSRAIPYARPYQHCAGALAVGDAAFAMDVRCILSFFQPCDSGTGGRLMFIVNRGTGPFPRPQRADFGSGLQGASRICASIIGLFTDKAVRIGAVAGSVSSCPKEESITMVCSLQSATDAPFDFPLAARMTGDI